MDEHFGRYRITEQTLRRPQDLGFEPRFHLDDGIYDDLRGIERADHDLAQYSLDRQAARRLLEEARTRNAYGTASLEGNPLTLDEVESLLAQDPRPEDTRPDEREILNQVALMERLDTLGVPTGPDEVAHLHGRMFHGVLDDAGQLKTTQNFIGRAATGEVVFLPSKPEEVRPDLTRALDWLHHDDAHPLVRAIVFFHEFQGIHPFRDGNGRIGRALHTIILHAHGYPGIRYAHLDFGINADPQAYYAALAEVERNGYDYTPWIRYLARLTRDTFDDAVRRFRNQERLPASLNDRQRRLADWFAHLDHRRPGSEVKFNDVHTAFPTVPERTLRRDLATLRDHQVLRMTGQKKGARYRLQATKASL